MQATNSAHNRLEHKMLVLCCILVLAGILTAGLWPFFPPKNQVSWLPEGNGLSFGDYATVFSSDNLNLGIPGDCTLALWLEPGLTFDSNTILDIYTPEIPFKLRIRQSGDDLVVLRNYRNQNDRKRAGKMYVDHVFRQNTPVLVTVSGGAQGTAIYVNGKLAKIAQQLRFSGRDLDGQLILGAAPVVDDRWSGKLRRLAIYNRQLNAEEVSQRFQELTSSNAPSAADQSLAALYTFSEGSGTIVHNQAGLAPDLAIPKRFKVIGQALLTPPWNEYSPGWSYYKYILVNISGFIPLGFLFYALWLTAGNKQSALVKTIMLGAATSLLIEILQAYIPTRQSGVTDLITNTLGTYLGVVLYQTGLIQDVISNIRAICLPSMALKQHATIQPEVLSHSTLEKLPR
jgi:VanZ family protein